jgi:hypothetical protein
VVKNNSEPKKSDKKRERERGRPEWKARERSEERASGKYIETNQFLISSYLKIQILF